MIERCFKGFRVVYILIVIGILSSMTLRAQVGNAILLGAVTDTTGAPIAGASVKITNTATHLERSFTTDESGQFELPYLAVGTYQITVTKENFETKTVSGVSVQSEQRARVDFVLALGSRNEVVEVTGSAPILNTDSSTVGQVIDSRRVADMPLNGRNWISLAFLAPGVVKGTGTNADFFAQGGSASVNGGRVQANNFTIDGTDNNDLLFGGLAMNLSVEAVQEFKVQNDLYTAEYGRTGGGQINLVTKSGGNVFHGDVFNFLRNSYFDGRNYFATKTPSLRRNQFGGILGGPIKRDRIFFFVDYEGMRMAQGLTQTTTTPTADQRQGRFGSTTIIDPQTGLPFANNTIQAQRISTIASAILSKYYRNPTNTSVSTNNFTSTYNSTENDDQFTVRSDFKLSARDTAFVRVSHSIVDRFVPSVFNDFGNGTNLTTTNATIDNLFVISPQQINELRLGLSRPNGGAYLNQVLGTDLITPLGIKDITPVTSPQYVGFPAMSISGYASIGVNYYAPVLDFPTFYDLLDDHTYIKGRHSLKAGTELKFSQQFNQTGFGVNGSIGFSPTYTGNALADFLLGLPSAAQKGTGSTREYLEALGQSYYFMDDWRVTDRLTLNLGVRYEYNPPWVEKENRLSDLSMSSTGKLTPIIANTNGVSRGIIQPDKNDFAPRIGFAYRPFANNGVVVRGGYGVFFNQVITNMAFLIRENPPFYSSRSLTNVAGKVDFTLEDPFPTGVGSQAGYSNYVDSHIRDAYIQQWSLNIEKELPWRMGAEIGYVGSKGTKLPILVATNQAMLGSGSTDSRRPDPNYSQLVGQVGVGGSSYNALQAKLEKRAGNGLNLLIGYTYQKSLDIASSSQGAAPQNSYNLAAEWAPSDYNKKHALVASYVWELPFGEGKKWLNTHGVAFSIFGGWSTTGIVTIQSGFPFSVGLSGNISSSGVGADRPNRIGKGSLSSSQRSVTHWLDSSAFTLPAQYTFGTSRRNILSGPGLMNWDQGLSRTIQTVDRQALQLRFDAFNSLNHPNFSNPAASWNLATFGHISSAADPRILQFAAKYIF